MAQNKQSEKRNTRAKRRAAEEQAARERAEQAAKERKQQTIIGAIAVAVIVILIVVAGIAIYGSIRKKAATDGISVDTAYSQLQAVKTKPAAADDKGGIQMSKDGYGASNKIADAPTVAIYMDPLCPGCGQLNRDIDPTLIELMNAGQINLEIHPMSFMDRYSTDEYSSRVSNSILYIAGNDSDPNHLLKYLANIYAEDFQPGEGSDYKSVSDDALKEQAIAAGVPQKVADAAFGREYQDWLDAINLYTPKRSELWQITGSLKGSMSTPTVTINGNFWDRNQLSLAGLDTKSGLLESLGITENQVGKEGEMPSIGATGKPISLTTGE